MEVVFVAEGASGSGQLMDGTCARQTFVARASNLVSVSVFFTYPVRSQESHVMLSLMEGVGRKQVILSTASTDMLEDSGWYEFPACCVLSAGARCEIMLYTMNCRAGMSPYVHFGAGSGEGNMFMGSKVMRGMELMCRFRYEA